MLPDVLFRYPSKKLLKTHLAGPSWPGVVVQGICPKEKALVLCPLGFNVAKRVRPLCPSCDAPIPGLSSMFVSNGTFLFEGPEGWVLLSTRDKRVRVENFSALRLLDARCGDCPNGTQRCCVDESFGSEVPWLARRRFCEQTEPWRRLDAGLALEGPCWTTHCRAFGHKVLHNHGFHTFGPTHTAPCPMCHKPFSPTSVYASGSFFHLRAPFGKAVARWAPGDRVCYCARLDLLACLVIYLPKDVSAEILDLANVSGCGCTPCCCGNGCKLNPALV
jgi:hypothetical protein